MSATISLLIQAVDQTGKALKSSEQGIQKLSKAFIGISIAAAAVGVAMKKAFDLGREGAAIQQTKDSFHGMLQTMGAAPGVFEDIMIATGGVVTEFEAVASTSTLLMGAGDELGRSMAEAAPELMEIARAAAKLNPTLGDTTYMYESLGRGIKRASPLILDNLGLTIKVGEANEQYAESIGKTVEALTAEDQKAALLNATLEAGRVLINQAGGDVASATDEYDKLTAHIGEATDEFKKMLNEGILPIIKTLNQFIEGEKEVSERQEDLNRAVQLGIIDMSDYGKELGNTGRGFIDAAAAHEDLKTSLEEFDWFAAAEATAAYDMSLVGLVETEKDTFQVMGDVSEATATLNNRMNNMAAQAEAAAAGQAALWNNLDTSIDSTIENMLESIDFMAAGGLGIQEMAAEVWAALAAGEISHEEAEGMLQQLYEAAEAIRVDLEDGSVEAATTQFANAMEQKVREALTRSLTAFQNAYGGSSTTQPQQQSVGGPLSQFAEVGELGPEFIINGVVVPAHLTRMLKALGVGGARGFASGGSMSFPMIDGVYGAVPTPASTSVTSSTATISGGIGKVAAGGGAGAPDPTETFTGADIIAAGEVTAETIATAATSGQQQTIEAFQASMNTLMAQQTEERNLLMDKLDELIRKTASADDMQGAFVAGADQLF